MSIAANGTVLGLALLAITGCWRSGDLGGRSAPDADTDGDADTGTDIDGDTDADTDTGGDTDTSVDTGADTDADTDADTGTDTGTGTDGACDPGGEAAYAWHAFFGAASEDDVHDVAATPDGGIVVVGVSYESWDGPDGEPAIDGSGAGGFALAIDASGGYLWHTFFPGVGKLSVAVDDSGAIYVASTAVEAWDGPAGQAPLHSFASAAYLDEGDAVVLKLSAEGEYQWHSFYGGAAPDLCVDVAATAAGGVVLLGKTAADLETPLWDGPAGEAPIDASDPTSSSFFVLALDPDGGYQWHTFHAPAASGTWSSAANGAIAASPAGDIFVAAQGDCHWDGPAGEPPLGGYLSGDDDAFVLGLGGGGGYLWHAFYGGDDEGGATVVTGLAFDYFSGVVALVGVAADAFAGPGGESPVEPFGAGAPALFTVALDQAGGYLWHTFYADAAQDGGDTPAIAARPGGGFALAATSYLSWDGPAGEEAACAFGDGTYKLTAITLDAAGAYDWHAFFGGAGDVDARGIAAGGSGALFVVSSSDSFWPGPAGETPLYAYAGSFDTTIVKIAE